MKQGFTLVEALVALLVLVLVAFGTYGFIEQSTIASANIDREARVDKILVQRAFFLKSLEFDQLLSTECSTAAQSPAGHVGLCRLANGQLEMGPATAATASTRNFERRMNWDGEFSDSGLVCIEVFRCQALGGGRILELTLKAAYAKAKSGDGPGERRIVFRRPR
jgi:prepilin-type N-terminal cleavage/methylation domain-containing protein